MSKVRSYTKSDGTRVRSHSRASRPGAGDTAKAAGVIAVGSLAGVLWGMTRLSFAVAVLVALGIGLLVSLLGAYGQHRFRRWKRRNPYVRGVKKAGIILSGKRRRQLRAYRARQRLRSPGGSWGSRVSAQHMIRKGRG